MMWSAFILGLLGSLHCAAMCGPLMLGLGNRNYNWFSFAVHHLGRWLAYAGLAALFYLLVSPLYVFELQQYVALVSGILILLYGLKSYIPPVERIFRKLTEYLSNQMSSNTWGRTGNIGLGFLNGLLPCGLSFSAAILSVNTGNLTNAMTYMILFGIGTTPVLLIISSLPSWGRANWVQKVNSWLPRMMILAGFLLIIRSAGLGIPYLSPDYNAEEEKMECCEP